jgi:penicillin G amidase
VFANTRLLRAVNLSIAVLLIAFVAACYWYAWRPLPQTTGGLQAPISAPATIARDAIGVPHITAATWQDALFLQGFVTAQDRMWQMDAMRRLAAGELAEIIGTAGIESDVDARRMLLPRIAEAQYRVASPEAKAIYAAYARGVNYYLERNRGRLPLEFSILRYDPRPWRVEDSILVGLQMYRTLTPAWRDEIEKHRAMAKGDPKKVEFLFAAGGAGISPGSNAWTISGKHTASGKPILANDPHLDYTLPSTWYLVHLKAPDLDVTGASLPGLPAVIIGHNRRIAWGVTNLQFDAQDLYREQLDKTSGRYLYKGQMLQARAEREPIQVKGEKTVDGIIWVTRHGPIYLTEQNQDYALRWVAAELPRHEYSFLALDRAGTWEQFKDGLRTYFGPSQNFVYADVDGNIGYHAAGGLPLRENCVGDLPADGSQDSCEWKGLVPFEEMPELYNPESGIIVTANQNPFTQKPRYISNGFYAAPYRARQIRTLLESREKWNAPEMLTVQKDVYSSFAHFLAQETADAWEKKPAAALREAALILKQWNGQMEKGTAAPSIIALMVPTLQKMIARNASPELTDADMGIASFPALEQLFRERPAGWFANYDEILLAALKSAVEEGQKSQGSNVERWDYGQAMTLSLNNPVAGQLPVIGKYFNIGPVPMSGSSTSIKQTTRRLGPSMRMIVDFANLDASLANITIGQSGHRLSSHYKDQWDAYYAGRSFPMQFDKIDVKETLSVRP